MWLFGCDGDCGCLVAAVLRGYGSGGCLFWLVFLSAFGFSVLLVMVGLILGLCLIDCGLLVIRFAVMGVACCLLGCLPWWRVDVDCLLLWLFNSVVLFTTLLL